MSQQCLASDARYNMLSFRKILSSKAEEGLRKGALSNVFPPVREARQPAYTSLV